MNVPATRTIVLLLAGLPSVLWGLGNGVKVHVDVVDDLGQAVTNAVGVVTNCHYSKIVDVYQRTIIGGDDLPEKNRLVLESSVFNPRPNDPNLEANTRSNLAEVVGAEARWP